MSGLIKHNYLLSSIEEFNEVEDVELSTLKICHVIKAPDIDIQWATENDIRFEQIAALREVNRI